MKKIKVRQLGRVAILLLGAVFYGILIMDNIKMSKIKKVKISQLIDQSKFELVGGVWTDEDGKIHFVGLKTLDNGFIVPDFPDMGTVYIKDVAQVGVER